MLRYKLLISLIMLTLQAAIDQENNQKFQLTLFTGLQQENLHWSIAGNSNGTSPNVLSELKWTNITGINTGAYLNYNVWKRLSIELGITRAFTVAGKVTDRDYTNDNRQTAVYDESFNSDKGSTTALEISAAYKIINTPRLELLPGIGFIINQDFLFLIDHSNRFTGLNSTYKTKWQGPFIKFNGSYKVADLLKLISSISYYQFNYSAIGDWNLRSDFAQPVSYRHSANAYGINAKAGIAYALNSLIGIQIDGNYFFWQTGNGNDNLYLTNGKVDKTQLNQVIKNGFQLNLGLNLKF